MTAADSEEVATCGSTFGESAAHALVADRYADADARRSAYLSFIVKVLGRCRYCRGGLSDKLLARTPGLCSRPPCKRRAAREGMGGGASMLVLPSERDAQQLSDADDRRRLELAHVRIGETDEDENRAVTPAEARRRVEEHESAKRLRKAAVQASVSSCQVVTTEQVASAVEEDRPARGEAAPAACAPPAADFSPANEEEPMRSRHVPCDECGSGSRHRKTCSRAGSWARKNGAAKNGVAHAMPPPPEEVHGCDPKLLSDEDLVLCIAEARARVRSRERLAEQLAATE